MTHHIVQGLDADGVIVQNHGYRFGTLDDAIAAAQRLLGWGGVVQVNIYHITSTLVKSITEREANT